MPFQWNAARESDIAGTAEVCGGRTRVGAAAMIAAGEMVLLTGKAFSMPRHDTCVRSRGTLAGTAGSYVRRQGVIGLRWFLTPCLLIGTWGCHSKQQSGTTTESDQGAKSSFSAADAREALIRMIQQDHPDDRLLQGALPYLRTLEAKQAADGVVEIGTWKCYLKERRFTGEYVSTKQKIFADFGGDFVRDKEGHWKGVISRQRRNFQ
jgi:hypothetical protein